MINSEYNKRNVTEYTIRIDEEHDTTAFKQLLANNNANIITERSLTLHENTVPNYIIDALKHAEDAHYNDGLNKEEAIEEATHDLIWKFNYTSENPRKTVFDLIDDLRRLDSLYTNELEEVKPRIEKSTSSQTETTIRAIAFKSLEQFLKENFRSEHYHTTRKTENND